jgi:hypothetical protein
VGEHEFIIQNSIMAKRTCLDVLFVLRVRLFYTEFPMKLKVFVLCLGRTMTRTERGAPDCIADC